MHPDQLKALFDQQAPSYDQRWEKLVAFRDGLQRMREAYGRDVAVLPAAEIEANLVSGGFDSPTQFFQAGLIHAWYSRRAARIRKA